MYYRTEEECVVELGEKIASLRKAKGLTQAELGEKVAVTFQAVSKWERGESYPDFATISRLARLFEVPISYFEEDGEQNAAPERPPAEKTMLGVCRTCGKALYEGDEAETEPALVCKTCRQREIEEKRAKEAEAERQRRIAAAFAEQEERKRKAERRRLRNKGLIWAGVYATALTVFAVIGLSQGPRTEDVLNTLLGYFVLLLFGFPFICQMFWDGKVRDVAGAGGHIIGTPGVIFTLDLDGLIFLVGVKLLFAVLRFAVWLLTSAVTVAAAIVIAPFTFVPQLMRLNKGLPL